MCAPAGTWYCLVISRSSWTILSRWSAVMPSIYRSSSVSSLSEASSSASWLNPGGFVRTPESSYPYVLQWANLMTTYLPPGISIIYWVQVTAWGPLVTLHVTNPLQFVMTFPDPSLICPGDLVTFRGCSSKNSFHMSMVVAPLWTNAHTSVSIIWTGV